MDSSQIASLSKGQLIDEAANCLSLLATRAGTRPEYYRVLVKTLRKLAVDIEMGDGTGPKDFKEAYDKLGGAPESLNNFVAQITQDKQPQMPPPDNKILEDLLPPKKKMGRPRKVVE